MLAGDTLSSLALERGDFDHNDTLDAADLDLLSERVRQGAYEEAFDTNRDAVLNDMDRVYWVESIHRTYVGDSNLDGAFSTSDLVLVFQQGLYEDGVPQNAAWTSGDWNGDTECDSTDLVYSFQSGGFEVGTRPLRPLDLQLPRTFGRGPQGEYLTVFDTADWEGATDPFTQVTLQRTSGEPWEATVASDEFGRFQFSDVDLQKGTNDFRLIVTDANGQQQATAVVVNQVSSSLNGLNYAPWGEFVKTDITGEAYPASVATAFIPDGMTRQEYAKELTSLGAQKPLAGRPSATNTPTLLEIVESEAPTATGVNDTVATAELLGNFGTATGDVSSLTISGVLQPTPTRIFPVEDDGDMNHATETNLTVNTAVIASGRIGDGQYGTQGLATGDFDFFVVRGVTQGQTITIDVNTPVDSLLDSFVFVYDSTGTRVDVGDDDGISTDTFLDFRALSSGDFWISIASYGSFGPLDPFDSASGIGAGQRRGLRSHHRLGIGRRHRHVYL